MEFEKLIIINSGYRHVFLPALVIKKISLFLILDTKKT